MGLLCSSGAGVTGRGELLEVSTGNELGMYGSTASTLIL